MASAPFRPFDDLLDQEAALRRLREAVAGADDGELFLERRRAETLGFDDGRLKTASFDRSQERGAGTWRPTRRRHGGNLQPLFVGGLLVATPE